MMKRNILFGLILLLWGCDTTTDSFTSLFKSFDRQGMLSNIGNNMVIPAYNDVVTKSSDFNISLQNFKSNPTALNLVTAQTQWMSLNTSWRKCEVYGFGPLDNLLLKTKIDNYHCDVTSIESHITSQSIIDLNYINTVPVSDKGIVAAEYLLFGDGVQDPLSLLSADTQRVNYLISVSLSVNEKLIQVQNEWISSGNNFISTFITSDGNNVSSSIGKMINYQVMILDEIKNMKLGKPMGKFDASVIPAEVESYYSKQSIPNINTNMIAIEAIFNGNGSPGVFDLLDHLGAKDNNGTLLSDKIKAKFILIHNDLSAFTTSLDDAVVNDFSSCDTLYNDVYDLYILVKVDVMNQLGLLLTFNDNDGD
jgi:predicted lipoprotein